MSGHPLFAASLAFGAQAEPMAVQSIDTSKFPLMKVRVVLPAQMISGATLDDFIRECYKLNVAYIAWDSRIGLFKKDAYYIKWRMGRLADLQVRRDYGRLEFVTQLKHTDRRYINIYRLRPEAVPTIIEEPRRLLTPTPTRPTQTPRPLRRYR